MVRQFYFMGVVGLRKLSMAGALLGFALLGGCGDDAPELTPEEKAAIEDRAATLMPEDPALAEIYEYSCYSCHANPETGAPLTGDKAGWEPRMEKGMDVLLNNTINGFKGMPPLGMCMDCTYEQFIDLIVFMAELDEEEPSNDN